MKKMIMTTLTMIFILLLTVGVVSAEEAPENDVKAYYNNKKIILPASYGAIFIDNNSRTMIPLRGVSENLGLRVDWDQATWTATIEDSVKVKIGDDKVVTPEGIVKMDTKAVLIDGRTYVPLRFILESLDGFEIDYKFTAGIHRIDIFSSVNSDVDEVVGQKNGYENWFSNDLEFIEELTDELGTEHVEIEDTNVKADIPKPSLNEGVNLNYYAPFEGQDDYYELVIMNFEDFHQKAIKIMLNKVTDASTAKAIFDQLDDGFNYRGVTINEWITHGNYKYIFIKLDTGVIVKINNIG